MHTILGFLLCCQLISSGEPLLGGVKHSESLEPIRDTKTLHSSSKWFRIPRWLEGSWDEIASSKIHESNDQTHSVDDQSHPQDTRLRLLFGWQKDRDGNAWQGEFDHGTEPGNKVINQLTRIIEDINEPVGGFELRVGQTVYETRDGKADATKVVERKEVIQKLAQSVWDPNILLMDSDTQIYDASGFPSREFRTVSLFKRARGYAEKPSDGDRNLQDAFCDFLRQNGHLDLFPDKVDVKGESK